ncbi:MAG TPA: hypothetical protein VFW40_02625 [Capsulimonadaceae bacterium]|nr:hypothetical protein [Capsulimonadaceae bacterium]
MSRANLRNIWSRLPVWGALLLSGGMLIGGARTDAKPQPPGRSDFEAGQVFVKIDGENILISQDGRTFEKLRLGDTREALHLRELLRHEGSDGRTVAIPVGSMIVASGGAHGKGKKPPQEPISRLHGKRENGK